MRALVVGSLVADLVFHVPRRPAPGEVVLATRHERHLGGKGFNQAVALARLGAEVTLVGAVGDDRTGGEFVAALLEEGVDGRRVARLPGVQTAVAVPLVTPDGDVAFVQHPGANALLAPEHLDDLPDADVLLLQGEVPEAASRHAADEMSRRGAAVQLNPAPAHDVGPDLLALCGTVVPNEVEAVQLLEAAGREVPGEPHALACALAVEGRRAVVTLGARGAAWAEDGDSGLVTPPAVVAVDATGAGDSFCAALAVALHEGRPLPEAVAFACAAGAHAATVHGARPGLPGRAEIAALSR